MPNKIEQRLKHKKRPTTCTEQKRKEYKTSTKVMFDFRRILFSHHLSHKNLFHFDQNKPRKPKKSLLPSMSSINNNLLRISFKSFSFYQVLTIVDISADGVHAKC